MTGQRRWWILAIALLGAAPSAWAQLDQVLLSIGPSDVGIDGVVRVGTWTPARLTLQNQGAASRAVICQWVLQDVDGDEVRMQRRVTLNPLREETVWLYAPIPLRTYNRPGDPWRFQVIDADSGRVLALRDVLPNANKLLPARVGAIGVCSSARLGLNPYIRRDQGQRFDFQHEELRLLQGMSLEALPDRWYGLSLMHAIIWTSEGGDPNDALVTPEMQQAIRDWVRRGGRLIISVPAVKKVWTSSALSDLLPVGSDRMRSVQDDPPMVMGPTTLGERAPINYTVFDVPPGSDVSILERDRQGNPVIVSRRYGFGSVTQVGVDLADRRLIGMGLPKSREFWGGLFGWTSPVFDASYMADEIKNQRMAHPKNRAQSSLTNFVPRLIDMRNTTAPALLAAIVVFGLYWLLAGPVSFMALKAQGKARYSWVAFVAVVGVFTAVAWGGAYVMQPSLANVAHFTLLDADARSGTVHARSFLSLYLPKFGAADIEIDPQRPDNQNTLASPGLRTGLDEKAFLDPQSYAVNAAAPSSADVPYRSTAKQFEVDFLGRIDAPQPGLPEPWVLPQGDLRINNLSFPEGVIAHGLPGPLRDVVLIYCPGDGQTPFVKRYGDWEPKTQLDVGDKPWPMRLVLRPRIYTKDRNWSSEGFLGAAIGNLKGVNFEDLPEGRQPAGDKVKSAIEMLSFYDMLPSPNFRDTGYLGMTVYNRSLGRMFDLSALTTGRRLIVLGHLEAGPLPLPFTADGDAVQAEGWTVLRWIYDFD